MSGVTSRGCSSAAAGAALLSVCCAALGVGVSPLKGALSSLQVALCLLQLSPSYSPHTIRPAIISSLPLDFPGYL